MEERSRMGMMAKYIKRERKIKLTVINKCLNCGRTWISEYFTRSDIVPKFMISYKCLKCGFSWELSKEIKTVKCPKCGSKDITSSEPERIWYGLCEECRKMI
jgi:DNA-directed RNA polymerase subunit RPC12/RpoP